MSPIVKDRRKEWKICVSQRPCAQGASANVSRNRRDGKRRGVRKLKRDEQPLFRGESPGFINLLLHQHIAKLARTSRSIQTGNRGCGFHSAILHGNGMAITIQDDDLAETPHP